MAERLAGETVSTDGRQARVEIVRQVSADNDDCRSRKLGRRTDVLAYLDAGQAGNDDVEEDELGAKRRDQRTRQEPSLKAGWDNTFLLKVIGFQQA